MSFSRWAPDSDLYIYKSGDYWCSCCCLQDGETFSCETSKEMIEHVREHVVAGHQVWDDVIEALEWEKEQP